MADDDNTGAPQVSDADRDLLIRTAIGEANNQPDIGKAAVAHVALNRLASGDYGPSMRAVLLAPNQFEPWTKRAGELLSVSPDSPAYKKTAAIVDGVLSGDTPDPTSGATHFYAPAAQAALGRARPAWAQGDGQQIGAHVFYAPNGPVQRSGAMGAIDTAMAKPATLGEALPYTATTSASPTGGKSTAAAAPTISDDDLLKLYGPKAAPVAVPAASPANAASGAPTSGAQSSGPLSDDDLLAKYGPKVQSAGPDAPDPLAAAKANIPANAAGQIELLASNRQMPDAIANNSIGNIAAATGADPKMLRDYFDAYKSRPMTTGDAVAQGLKQGVSLGTGPAIGGAMDAAAGVRPFSQGMAARVSDLKAAEAAHPYAALGGEVAGSLPTLAAAGGTAIGARALGLTGGNMLTRMGAGAGTNALIGAADAGVRSGGDISQMEGGAGAGALVGGIAPLAGRAIGSGFNALTGLVGNPATGARAENALLRTMTTSGNTPESLAAELASNPRLSIMDVDPAARTMAQGLATTPGKPAATLQRAYADRMASADGAVSGAFDNALGATPDTQALLANLQATARANASKGFGDALNGAKPVDVSGVIKAIDDRVSPGIGQLVSTDSNIPRGPVADELLRLKARLTDGTSTLTDPNRLHAIQSEVRTMADTLGNSANGQDKLTASALRDMRGKLVSAIDDAAGGKYRPAQAQYADDMSVRDAFTKGLDVLRNRAGEAGLEDRPEAWRAAIAGMSADEQNALRQGVRTAVDQKIGAHRNGAAAGEAITDSDMNLDKLRAIVGDKEAGQLAKRLSDEQRMRATNAALFQGSQTEPRRQASLATAVRNIAPMSMEIGLPTFAGYMSGPGAAAATAAAALARRGVSYLGQRSDLARNNLLAGMISASGADASPVIQQLQNRLLANANAGQGVGAGANLLTAASRPLWQSKNSEPPSITYHAKGGL